MRGKVFLIKKGVGKIIIGDEETPIIDLPMSFDNDDIVEVEFVNNDISKKPYKMVAFSNKRYYGFVIKEFNPTTGIILPTYPEMTAPVLYEKLPLKKKDKVSFIIKKENDKLKAIDIKQENSFKCNSPIFGQIKKRKITPKEGIITEIVKEIPPKQETINGRISYLNPNKNFGFISNQTYKKIFFSISWFKGFYKKEPKVGDSVDFFIRKSDKGLSVSKFSKPSKPKILSKNEQYIIVNNNKKFNLLEYEKVFNQEPLVGDIVYFLDDKLLATNKVKEDIVFTIFDSKNLKKGKVKVVKDKFGFISAGDKDIFFLKHLFVNFYKREPKKGDIVYFIDKQNDRGYQVDKFGYKDINVANKEFINFAEIEDSLYFAYISKDKKEIYKYNSENLSHALACYNAKNIPDIYKLQAINTLLELEYTNQRITKEKLLNQKVAILNRLKDRDCINRLDYIAELQKINYNPSKIDITSDEKYTFIKPQKIAEIVKNEQKLQIIKPVKIKEFRFEDTFSIIKPAKIIDIKITEPKWQIKEIK